MPFVIKFNVAHKYSPFLILKNPCCLILILLPDFSLLLLFAVLWCSFAVVSLCLALVCCLHSLLIGVVG